MAEKLDKAVVLYMNANLNRNDPNGFRCGVCSLGVSDSSECLILDPSAINLENGVCGLFVPGGNIESTEGRQPLTIVPWETAGYTEHGPTYCGICKNFSPPSKCKKVEGKIDELGCCNAWER